MAKDQTQNEKAEFIKKVLKEKPEFSNVQTYFYVSPLEHILSGFLCEMTPNGAYVWRFLYPLFDKFDCLTLLYSQRLDYPEGYIDYDRIEKNKLADEFLYRIDKYIDDSYNYLTLEQFLSYVHGKQELLNHDHVLKTLGSTMILLNDGEKAKAYLEKAIVSRRAKTRKSFYDECNQLLTLAQGDLDKAKQLVLNWENDMRKTIGLPIK